MSLGGSDDGDGYQTEYDKAKRAIEYVIASQATPLLREVRHRP